MHDNGANVPVPSAGARLSGFGRLRLGFDEIILRLCTRLLAGATEGRIRLTLPSGAGAWIEGSAAPDRTADLTLNSYRVFWKSLRRGSLGFAESYMQGEAESGDLVALFRYFIANKAKLDRAGRGRFRVRSRDRAYHRSRANTHSGSRTNIAAHYDLGNAFYRLWLDPSLTYSSAVYATPGCSLEAAQMTKYDLILDALELSPSHRVLEIGCGWGAFARRAAARCNHVTGLTLSNAQLAAARGLAQAEGFENRIEVRLEDYRDTRGIYDRIASIEMIEAVGEENWPRYFSVLSDRLAPDGIAVLQAITIDETLFETYRRKADFIQRFVFPGGMLPTQTLIARHAHAAGFEVERLHAFGASYARTLAEWRHQFHANWPAIKALGFDDRFRRLWDYYLTYCQAGFEHGTIDVAIYRLRRSGVPAAVNANSAGTR